MFGNRQDAGTLLANRLMQLFGRTYLHENSLSNAVVIGLPRGGVIVALEVALSLKIALHILVSKKIPAPENAEFAIGAVSSRGVVVLDDRLSQMREVGKVYARAQEVVGEELRKQTVEYEKFFLERSHLPKALEEYARPDSVAIVVDDGIATGMTAIAALKSLRAMGFARTVLATPVIPLETYSEMKRYCDDVVALHTPVNFPSVGFYYSDFRQVEDEEVIAALIKANQPSDSHQTC